MENWINVEWIRIKNDYICNDIILFTVYLSFELTNSSYKIELV